MVPTPSGNPMPELREVMMYLLIIGLIVGAIGVALMVYGAWLSVRDSKHKWDDYRKGRQWD
jgi:cobalamin synthase